MTLNALYVTNDSDPIPMTIADAPVRAERPDLTPIAPLIRPS
ncbi:hypothetical protein [Deinococcus sp. KSM4-11]|nr:hypothetical protein [Deinococcus sp. KSM4-11]